MEDDWVANRKRLEQGTSRNPIERASEHFILAYRDYMDDVYRFHLSRVGDVQDAQDLTSETFQAAFEAFPHYRIELGTLKSWLFGIAHHKQVDYFRKRHRRNENENATISESLAAPGEELNCDAYEIECVIKTIRNLTPDRAEAVALHFLADLSLNEVALVMEKSYENAKKLVQRGLQDVRRMLESMR